MMIAVISDIHGNLAALQAVLEDIARQRVDRIVNLGDILSGPLQPAETADLLMAHGFTTIAGNHERQLLKAWSGPRDQVDAGTSDGYAATQVGEGHATWLRGLPPDHWLEPDLLLVHGTPASDLVYWMETVTPDFGVHGSRGVRAANPDEIKARLGHGVAAQRATLVLCGHTHVPRAVHCGQALIVNPGSVGIQAYDDTHPHYHCTENGSPDARYAIVERGTKGWQAHLCNVPYDWGPQARLAAERGRADWAHALATGCMPPAAGAREAS